MGEKGAVLAFYCAAAPSPRNVKRLTSKCKLASKIFTCANYATQSGREPVASCFVHEGQYPIHRQKHPQHSPGMYEFNERSAYPHPDDFRVMRPEYLDLEDGLFQATITIAPFKVTGKSATRAGARRAAIYEAVKTYRSYHPSYRLESPYPDEFVDSDNTTWRRVPSAQREQLGDYMFRDPEGEEDYTDIETMLLWDVRPALAEKEEED